PFVSDGLADNAGSHFELPQQLSGAIVERFEPAVHRAIENHIARGDNGAAPRWKHLGHRPNLFRLHRIPRAEFAAIPTRAGVHANQHADIRRARDVIGLRALALVTEIVVRNVYETGFR